MFYFLRNRQKEPIMKKIIKTNVFNFLLICFIFANASLQAEETIRIAASGTHSMAVKSDNSLWVWGENTFGQLGNGKQTIYGERSYLITENNDLYVPTKIMENIIEIAAGEGFSLAVNSNNELYAWGINDSNQLGDGTTVYSNVPKKILDNVVYINSYEDTSIAIRKDGSLWMWGREFRFDSRSGSRTISTPVLITENVKKAVLGTRCLFILDNNNRMYGMGTASLLGLNRRDSNTRISSPLLILTDIKDIAASGQSIYALGNDSRLLGWGSNGNEGRVGHGGRDFSVYSPVLISDDVKMVFSGYMYIKNDNSLWTWGRMYNHINTRATINGQGRSTGGELGDEIAVYGNRPRKIMDNIVLACGNLFNRMAVDKDGNLFTWGSNQFGQLGNGTAGIMDIVTYMESYHGTEFEMRTLAYKDSKSVAVPARITQLKNTD